MAILLPNTPRPRWRVVLFAPIFICLNFYDFASQASGPVIDLLAQRALCLNAFREKRPPGAEDNFKSLPPNERALANASLNQGLLGFFFNLPHGRPSENTPDQILNLKVRLRNTHEPTWRANQAFASKTLHLPRSIHVYELDDKNVVVKVQTAFIGSAKYPLVDLSPLSRAIGYRFDMMHLQLVNFTYQNTDLVIKDPISGLKLIDDYVDHQFDGNFLTPYLLFRKEVWREQELDLIRLTEEYESGAKDKEAILSEISKPGYPLFAQMGMILSEPFYLQGEPEPGVVEFKRLFSNSSDDPLAFVAKASLDPKLPLRFYDWLISGVSPNTTIRVESHSPIHERWYRSLGFKPTQMKVSDRWNMEIRFLQAPASDVISVIQRRLKEN